MHFNISGTIFKEGIRNAFRYQIDWGLCLEFP